MEQIFDADSLYQLREAVAAHAAWAGLSPDRVADVVIVAHELAANVIRHGAGRGLLRMLSEQGALCCEVGGEPGPNRPGVFTAHAGGGTAAPKPAAAAADGRPWPVERGHGLWMVDQLADDLTFGRGAGGHTATARFLLGPARPAAAEPAPG